MKIRKIIRTIALSLALFALVACATPKQPQIENISSFNLGVALYSQPQTSGDLLAGNIPENLPIIDHVILSQLDVLLAETFNRQSKHSFAAKELAESCQRSVKTDQGNSRRSALRYWSAVGRCMKVDYLVVPQIMEWREREGSSMGVMTPARVVMDTFVVDVNNEVLVSRSRYDETQSALTDNLLQTRKFMQRGGRWVEAKILAQEGMEKAVKELGL